MLQKLPSSRLPLQATKNREKNKPKRKKKEKKAQTKKPPSCKKSKKTTSQQQRKASNSGEGQRANSKGNGSCKASQQRSPVVVRHHGPERPPGMLPGQDTPLPVARGQPTTRPDVRKGTVTEGQRGRAEPEAVFMGHCPHPFRQLQASYWWSSTFKGQSEKSLT